MNDRHLQPRLAGQRLPLGAIVALAALVALAGLSERLSSGPTGSGPQHEAAGVGLVARAGNLRSPSMTATLAPIPTDTATRTLTALATATAPTTVTPIATLEPTFTAMPATEAAPSEPATEPTDVPPPTVAPEPTPRPLPTPDGVQRTVEVPILMYHYISTPPDGEGAVRRDLSVSPEQFAAQLAYLKQAGYTSVSLEDLALALMVGAPLPGHPIVLTFDDGYRDAYTNAYPLLKEYGFTGTFFLVTSYIDEGNPNYVTWQQVAEMSAGGMSMEAHGYTHADMEGRDRDYLIWQMLGSKEAIEARTGKPVRFFCYPSGYYDDGAMQVLHELGYWGATTISLGQEHTSDSLFDLQRVRVRGAYSVERLAALLDSLRAP